MREFMYKGQIYTCRGPSCSHRAGALAVRHMPRLLGSGAFAAQKSLGLPSGPDVFVPLSGNAYEAASGWTGKIIPCPIVDYGMVSAHRLSALAQTIAAELKSRRKVLVACDGGHGRTGTVLAAVAVVLGLTRDPVNWIRANYCERAVESEIQILALKAMMK